jgi:putative effector of murein hydrolase
VIATGILGAMVARPLFDRAGIGDPAARGFALGVTSHGIGTARALQVGEDAGAFAGLGMALAAIATALLVPAMLLLLR